MLTRIAIAAGLTTALLASALIAAGSAHAGPLYDNFCKGSTPTPQHVCDTIKAHEARKPVRPAGAAVSTKAAVATKAQRAAAQ